MNVRILLATLVLGCTTALAAARDIAVVTSFYPIYVATLNVVRDVPGVSVRNLAAPTQGCLHDYQVTPGDMRTLTEADVLVINGAGMESFLSRVAENLPQLRILDASLGSPLIAGGCAGCGNPDHAHHAVDPHVWVSVRGAQAQVLRIAQELAAAYPEHRDTFLANAAAYNARLDALHARLADGLATTQHRRIITFHASFGYFAREFGLEIVATVEAEAGEAPSAAQLADVVRTARSTGARAIFIEPHQPGAGAQVVAREAGLPLGTLDAVATGPADPALARDAYVVAMEHNLATLTELLR